MPITHEDGTITHVGRVIDGRVFHASCCNSDYERFYARVILDFGIVDDIAIGTVSYASSWGGSATADATPEALAEMASHEAHRTAIFGEEREATASLNRLYRLAADCQVRFVKGRKVKNGTVATLAWFGQKFDSWRVGVRTGAGMIFSDAENCQREHDSDEQASLSRAWDRWVAARIAYEDLIESEHNVRGAFDPKQSENRWHAYQQCVARWLKDWPTIDHDHRMEVCKRIAEGRNVTHIPNKHEAPAKSQHAV